MKSGAGARANAINERERSTSEVFVLLLRVLLKTPKLVFVVRVY